MSKGKSFSLQVPRTIPSPGKIISANGKSWIEIAERRIPLGGPLPEVKGDERLIRYTSSLCPDCLRLLPAIIVERDNKLYIRKICPDHGLIEELYFSDYSMYSRLMKWEETGKGLGGAGAYTSIGAPCPYSCGLCTMHENHTALANLVVTNRCDLSCFYCFFYAERAGYVYEPSIEEIRFMARQLKRQSNGLNIHTCVQVTGGEPTVREDLIDVIKALVEEGVDYIQLNTNGITIARKFVDNPNDGVSYVRALRKAGVSVVYMSFDGVTPKVNWKNHYEAPFAIEAFRRGGLPNVVLVPTVLRTINDHQLGDIIRFAGKHIDTVRGVNFQPVSLTGRVSKADRERYRITIADVAARVEEQTNGEIPKDAWYPVPVVAKFVKFIDAITGKYYDTLSNHPMCGAATYVFIDNIDTYGVPRRFIPITEFFDVEGFIEYLDEARIGIESKRLGKRIALVKLLLNLRKYLDTAKMPKNINMYKIIFNVFIRGNYDAIKEFHYKSLFLGSMHFMDRYNYDVTRVRRCNIHYLMPDGRIIPFCVFNVLENLYRDYVQKKYKKYDLRLSEIKGFNPGEKYKRKNYINKILSNPIYWNAYRGIIYFKDREEQEVMINESGEEVLLKVTRTSTMTTDS
ncbi:MAG: radical SAM protein [Acidilobaceae archaeon]